MNTLELTIAEIRETHRMHQALVRACVRLDLQIQAIERRANQASKSELTFTNELPSPGTTKTHATSIHRVSGPVDFSGDAGGPAIVDMATQGSLPGRSVSSFTDLAILPLQESKSGIRVHERKLRQRLERLTTRLPVHSFVETICGFGAFGLAQIVGEAGDLSMYATPAKLWKRMGLAVVNGKSQRRVAGAEAITQGYSPLRRSMMFVIGDGLIKKENRYRAIYLQRKAYETAKAPELTKLQLHYRAHRYMEKRLLRDLWRAWRAIASNTKAAKAA